MKNTLVKYDDMLGVACSTGVRRYRKLFGKAPTYLFPGLKAVVAQGMTKDGTLKPSARDSIAWAIEMFGDATKKDTLRLIKTMHTAPYEWNDKALAISVRAQHNGGDPYYIHLIAFHDPLQTLKFFGIL